MPPAPISFTVRRPTPVSRPSSSGPESSFKIPALPRHLASAGSSAASSPLAGSPRALSSREDSDDDGETGIVFANGPGEDDGENRTDSSDEDTFIAPSGQRLHQKKKRAVDTETLVIPSKPNPDWREAARKRRAACARVQSHTARGVPSFVPDSASAKTGADGSVGGLGMRDTINSGPQLSGLQMNKRAAETVDDSVMAETEATDSVEPPNEIEETEDQRALRAILAGGTDSGSVVDVIPIPPLSEADALKQDVEELPDVATADDYERVPISAFGAAMLRGMGWTDGAVAPKKRKNGLSELYLPQARPALLGIGAKEREQEDDGSGKKKQKRPDMRYVPVARREGGRDEESSRSGMDSRRSPPRGYEDRERRRDRDDRDRRERDKDRSRDRERKVW